MKLALVFVLGFVVFSLCPSVPDVPFENPVWATSFATMKDHMAKVIKIHKVPELKQWLEVVTDEVDKSNSNLRCFYCSRFCDIFQAKGKRPPITTLEGLSTDIGETKVWTILYNHDNSLTHRNILNRWAERNKNIPQIVEKFGASEEWLQATTKVFHMVLFEAQNYIPFTSHKDLCELFKINGVDIGTHQNNNVQAAKMVRFISDRLLREELSELMSEPRPVSIILDSSTDRSMNHYFIMYIRTVIDGEPKVFFYKIKLLPGSANSEGLLNCLVDALTEDGLSEYFRVNMVGYASDGASVMTGSENGLATKLSEHFQNNFYTVHCMAHRLHLAVRKAVLDYPSVHRFERTINEVYNFFSNSYKRKNLLKKMLIF